MAAFDVTSLALAGLLVVAPRLPAQVDETPARATLARAAESITAAELRRHAAVLGADSMRRRPWATPSPELARTAQYIAGEFQRLGLTPAGGSPDDPWLQRYPVPGQLRVSLRESKLWLIVMVRRHGRSIVSEAGQEVYKQTAAPLAVDARFDPAFAISALPQGGAGSEDHFVLVAGPQDVTSLLQEPELRGNVVVYVPPRGIDSTARRAVVTALARVSGGTVILSEGDSARFVESLRAAPPPIIPLANEYLRHADGPRTWPWIVEVRPGALDGALAAVGADLAELRTATGPIVHRIPSAMVLLAAIPDTAGQRAPVTAPNVVARLEGRDSVLREEHVIIIVPMDGADSPSSGADRMRDSVRGADNRRSIDHTPAAGLLALAKAWSQPGARPRRSVVFVATSGNGLGQPGWGANFFTAAPPPAVTSQKLVGLIAVGRLAAGGDSVMVDGLEDLVLATPPAWVAAAHPELGLSVVDGETAFTPGTAHFAFAPQCAQSGVS